MADSDQDRMHQPTASKRNRAFEEGRVPQSQDLVSAVAFSIAVGLLWVGSDRLAQLLGQCLRNQLQYSQSRLMQPGTLVDLVRENFANLLALIGPGVAIFVLGVWLIHLLQRQFVVRLTFLQPKLSRLSPGTRFQQIVSWHTVRLQVEKMIRFGVFVAVMTLVISSQSQQLWGAMRLDLVGAALLGWRSMMTILGGAAGILTAMAVIDYGLQRWRFELSLRMTDDELREETRSTQRNAR